MLIEDQKKQRTSFINMWENSYKQLGMLKDKGAPFSQIKQSVIMTSQVLSIGMGEYRKTEGTRINQIRAVAESLINQT